MISVHILSYSIRGPSRGHGRPDAQVTTLRNDRGAKTFAHNVEYIYVPLSFFHSCHAVACACWWCRRLWKSSAILSALHGGCCGIHSRWGIDHPESNGFCGSPRHLSGADVRSLQSPFTRSKLSSESTIYREMFKSTIPKAQHLSGKRNVSWWKSPQLPLLFLLNCTCEERTVRPQWHCATGLHELKDQPCGLFFLSMVLNYNYHNMQISLMLGAIGLGNPFL